MRRIASKSNAGERQKRSVTFRRAIPKTKMKAIFSQKKQHETNARSFDAWGQCWFLRYCRPAGRKMDGQKMKQKKSNGKMQKNETDEKNQGKVQCRSRS